MIGAGSGSAPDIRLGHIVYSNGYPVHARLLEQGPPEGVRLVSGTPADLNAALASGRIDVGPCSSIEYARRGRRYRILPDLTIASDGPVRSILLETRQPPSALDGLDVFVPTASATSVVLLRVLLEMRWDARARLHWFDQSKEDPFARGAAAVLWIGDAALERPVQRDRTHLDLGEAWTEWTALPFAYALWQTRLGPERDGALMRLHERLVDSRAWFDTRAARLAETQASRFHQDAGSLLRYWRSLTYRLDDRVERGLYRFFECAARLGEAEPVGSLRLTPRSTP